jgi:hypothetical protein
MFDPYTFYLHDEITLMQNNFTHTYQQSVLVKYKKRHSRLRNAIREGSFSRYSSAKKRQLFQCLARYERQLRHWGIASGVALLLPVLPLQAQTPLPVGAEFRVNTHTTNSQNLPATAMDSDGDFVVTWYSNGQDGYGYGIYAQRYDPAGLSQGPEFRVNTYTTGLQREPAVAMDSDGDFVIAWHSNVQDGNSLGIYAQRYDNAGLPLGVEFQVNTYTTGSQSNPAIASNSYGDFVVTWSSDGQDGNSGGIFARRYDNTGLPLDPEFQVNTYTTGLQSVPAIVMDSDGDFVVTWFSSGQDGSDGGIYAQRYDNAGTPQGTEFRVNSYTTGFQGLPAIGMDSNGNFVIAWASDDGNSDGVFARLYDNAGTPQGTEFLVNTYTNSQQRNNAVAMDSDGDFVVTWRSSGQDGSVSGIYAQRYDNAVCRWVLSISSIAVLLIIRGTPPLLWTATAISW